MTRCECPGFDSPLLLPPLWLRLVKAFVLLRSYSKMKPAFFLTGNAIGQIANMHLARISRALRLSHVSTLFWSQL
jgi:hypothetical protein